MTTAHLPVDLTVSSKDRFVAYANNIFNQVKFDPTRSTPTGFEEYNTSSLPTSPTIEGQLLIKNARMVIEHDRIGSGLPAFVSVPNPSVTERYIDYHRTSAAELVLSQGTAEQLEVVDTAASIADICTSLNTNYGTHFTPDDIITPFVSTAATKFLQIDPMSVLYKGVLPLVYVVPVSA